MTAAPRIGKEDRPSRSGDVVLGEDWTSAEGLVDPALKASRDRRGFVSLNRSPLARKIILFNLLALLVLAGGVMFLNPFPGQPSVAAQRGVDKRDDPCLGRVRSGGRGREGT